MTAASDMAELNAQLRDELVIQQCTAEIVHVIRAQPHVVVRICQLMRRLNHGLVQPAVNFLGTPTTQNGGVLCSAGYCRASGHTCCLQGWCPWPWRRRR